MNKPGNQPFLTLYEWAFGKNKQHFCTEMITTSRFSVIFTINFKQIHIVLVLDYPSQSALAPSYFLTITIWPPEMVSEKLQSMHCIN